MRERPLSPHLQVYRWQITMTMSILHRATGVALGIGGILFAWWLVAAALGGEAYADFREFMASPLGLLDVLLPGYVRAGLRHLLWDVGYGYDIPTFYKTGWTVVALTAVTTLGLWWAGWTGALA